MSLASGLAPQMLLASQLVQDLMDMQAGARTGEEERHRLELLRELAQSAKRGSAPDAGAWASEEDEEAARLLGHLLERTPADMAAFADQVCALVDAVLEEGWGSLSPALQGSVGDELEAFLRRLERVDELEV
jgi:hypothetical protein